MTDPLATVLAGIVGDAHVLTDDGLRAPYEVDWTRRFRGRARLVVRPGSTEELAEAVAACARMRAPMVTQGGNTGLVGGGVPRDGETVVSTARLSWMTLDTAATQAACGAGTTIAALHAAAADADLAYGVDLASRDSATIGGTVATNAGGITVVRYGATREQVVGVEAVLANGTVVSRMGGLPKDSTGYDLPGLLCGSEGTLGIITSVRVRLRPRPTAAAVVLLGLASIHDALRVVPAVRAVPSLASVEYFHDEGLRLVVKHGGLAPPFRSAHDTYLLIACAGVDDPVPELAEALQRIDVDHEVAVASDRADREALWAYRERQTEAVSAEGDVRKLDVGVPVAALPAFEAEAKRLCAQAEVGLVTFGHLAEGNVHVELIGGDDSDGLEDALLRAVADLGGTISAEHGVGIAKARWLHLTRGEGDRAAMRAIKTALDPGNLLNPGVLFD